jgi:uncharacterized protein YoxC
MADNNRYTKLQKLSFRVTKWIGSPLSIIIHTAIFIGVFLLVPFGITAGEVLLILTTVVSLEAIYLAIFIQMTINRSTESIEVVEENIDDIQEDVEGLEKDIDHLEDDVGGITEDAKIDGRNDAAVRTTLHDIALILRSMQKDLERLKRKPS